MLTVGVVGGTGELRPVQPNKGLSHTAQTGNEPHELTQPENIITGLRGIVGGLLDV